MCTENSEPLPLPPPPTAKMQTAYSWNGLEKRGVGRGLRLCLLLFGGMDGEEREVTSIITLVRFTFRWNSMPSLSTGEWCSVVLG